MPNLPPPTLSGVSYEKNANRISCNWQPGSGQYFIIGLFTNGSLIDQASAMGFGGQLIPSETLDENTLYQVQVAQTDSFGGTPGPFGPPANLIVSPLKNIEVNNNGVQIEVSWDRPALGNVTGGLVYVVDQQSGDTVIMRQCDGTRCLLDPGGKLDSSKKYQLVAYGTCGISKGPASDYSDLICQIPTLDKVMYNILAEGKGCQIQAVSNTPLPDSTLLQLTVYQGSDVAARESQPITILSLTLSYTLDPSYIYMCRLRYQSGDSVGPESREVPLLTAPPRLLKTLFDGQAVEVFWENPDLPPRPAWGSAGIVEGTSVAGDGTFLGEYGKIIPTQPIDPARSYFIQLNPVLGKSRGPMANQIPVIAWTKNIQSAAYDGNCLKVCWEAGQGPNVTGYNLLILSGGSVLRPVPVAGVDLANGYKIVDMELSPGDSCQAALQAVGELSEGQTGPPRDIITAAPGIQSVAVESTGITAILREPTVKTGISGYQGFLYRGESVIAGPVAATLKEGQYRIEFPVGSQGGCQIQPGYSYSLRVQAIGASAQTLSGPLGEEQPLIVDIPAVESLAYDDSSRIARAAWGGLSNQDVTGYEVLLNQTDPATKETAATSYITSRTELEIAVDPAKSCSIAVRAVNSVVSGIYTTPVPVITGTTSVRQAIYDGEFLTLEWDAASQAANTVYKAVLYQGQEAIGSLLTGETQGVFAVELKETGSYSVRLTMAEGCSRGPQGPAFDIITAAPGIRSIVTGGDSIIVTLIEPAVKTTVAGYQGFLCQGGCVVAGPVAATLKEGQYRIEFPVGGQGGISLLETRDYYARVQAVGSTPSILQGPLSPAGQCLVQAPEIIKGGINGYQWTLEWTPCREVSVTGYKITLVDPNGNNPLYFYTTRTCHTGQNKPGDNQILASVQAVGDTAEGPLSAPKNLYGDGANYYFSPTGASAPAYLYRSYSHPPQAEDINLYLPDLFNRDPQIQSDIFILSKPSGSPAGFPYLLTIARDSAAWRFTPADRDALWTSYNNFLKDLDPGSNGTEPLLKPGAFNLLRQIIARALPLKFPEQLSYLYGFKADESCVDLIPGMRVRLDGEVRQYVGPPNDTNKYLNGFVPSGTVYLYIDDYLLDRHRLTGFDAYLSQAARPEVPSTQNIGGGGILDLYAPLGRRALYRLIYPQMIPGSGSMGYANMTYNLLVLGADNYTDLDGAARQYLAQGNFSGYDNKIIATFFRGRAALIPEIPVEINGSMRYVPVGTTIRSILARSGQVPASGRFLGSIAMERSTINLVQTLKEAQSPTATPGRTKILLAESVLDDYAGGAGYLDLPLLQGDRIVY